MQPAVLNQAQHQQFVQVMHGVLAQSEVVFSLQ
jgi:hypothetical protein